MNAELARARRDELDLTNAQLAEKVSLSQGYVENILYGCDQPAPRVIYRFERALDLPKGSLFGGSRTPQGDPSEPPRQPPNEPTRPTRRQDQEDTRTGPKRVSNKAAA
jgi:transcriptional regulator with XRE-family HTH domain